jgi:DNA-binding NtrC family response regulator
MTWRKSMPAENNLTNLTVLLVEDDDGIRTIATILLEAEGHTVHAMARGEEANEWLKNSAPDLLFTDVNMPGMGGIELARKALSLHPRLRVLLTSGEGRPDPAWLASGASYLTKPYDRRMLLAAIAAAVSSSA